MGCTTAAARCRWPLQARQALGDTSTALADAQAARRLEPRNAAVTELQFDLEDALEAADLMGCAARRAAGPAAAGALRVGATGVGATVEPAQTVQAHAPAHIDFARSGASCRSRASRRPSHQIA